ncbi:MAG: hypothetical protein US50_C0016G0017 [Candidatus Nomurabacteria bacterium GW2011_GWB1_37_5]|uniref:Uncharacterized protein n=1 Tax=Candidatus Nomurabacteria bacterium GW2011_GWB1_37_5 TaxID=1618742 RepID=A0A0G0GZD6_9BACT|nr:MAG: hypothetical protein US50_C0016G0017 [Candidatus Nomurabacteria bacterium GW2011_GWB1_37_5]
MQYKRIQVAADKKLAKIGLNLKYKIQNEKKGESWTKSGHIIKINKIDAKSRWMAVQSIEHILLHEIGHILLQDFVTKKMQKDKKVYDLFGDLSKGYIRNLKTKHQHPDFISTYAQVHPRDNFCEAFAVYAKFEGNIALIKDFLKERKKGIKVLNQMIWIKSLIKMTSK